MSCRCRQITHGRLQRHIAEAPSGCIWRPILTAAIKASARVLHVTSFSWLLAAVGTLLGRYCSANDLLVGVPFSTRRDRMQRR